MSPSKRSLFLTALTKAILDILSYLVHSIYYYLRKYLVHLLVCYIYVYLDVFPTSHTHENMNPLRVDVLSVLFTTSSSAPKEVPGPQWMLYEYLVNE